MVLNPRSSSVGPVAPLWGALRSPSGRARALDRGKATGISTRQDRAGAGVRAVVGRDRLLADDRAPCGRKRNFSLERAAFLTVLHRLFCGGSDRAADRWREDYRIEGVERCSTSTTSIAPWPGSARNCLGTGRRDAIRPALRQGCPGGGPVRAPARPADDARCRVHGYDEPPDQVP